MRKVLRQLEKGKRLTTHLKNLKSEQVETPKKLGKLLHKE